MIVVCLYIFTSLLVCIMQCICFYFSVHTTKMPSILKISNLVVTCNIGQCIDPYLVCHALGGNVGPNFPSAFVKLKNPDMTLSIFQSGNIIAIGCHSVEAAIEALYTTLERLSTVCNRSFFLYNFKTVLLVCSTKLSYGLNVYLLHKHFGLCSQWTPENFPGVKIELPYKKWTLVAFDSGTLILTGFSSYEEIPLAIKYINSELKLKRFALGMEQFSAEDIQESVEYAAHRSSMKRRCATSSTGNGLLNSTSLEYTKRRRRRTKRLYGVKHIKSHTRFRKEDNSIHFAMNSNRIRPVSNLRSRRVSPY
jgi:TATA-box binding protein (TBP) (component of TFIID and TFIIIB)